MKRCTVDVHRIRFTAPPFSQSDQFVPLKGNRWFDAKSPINKWKILAAGKVLQQLGVDAEEACIANINNPHSDKVYGLSLLREDADPVQFASISFARMSGRYDEARRREFWERWESADKSCVDDWEGSVAKVVESCWHNPPTTHKDATFDSATEFMKKLKASQKYKSRMNESLFTLSVNGNEELVGDCSFGKAIYATTDRPVAIRFAERFKRDGADVAINQRDCTLDAARREGLNVLSLFEPTQKDIERLRDRTNNGRIHKIDRSVSNEIKDDRDKQAVFWWSSLVTAVESERNVNVVEGPLRTQSINAYKWKGCQMWKFSDDHQLAFISDNAKNYITRFDKKSIAVE
jgi:hypothetical protein